MIRTGMKLIATVLLMCSLWACGGGGSGDSGGGPIPQVDSGTPSTPAGLSTQVVSATQIRLNWNPSTDDVGVFGYWVYGNGVPFTTISNGYTVSGLTPATQYCFSVAAFDGDGNISPQSSSTCATTSSLTPSAWMTVRSGASNELSNIVWTGDKLVVVEETYSSSTFIHTSADGLSWSDYPTSGFGFSGARDIVYGNNRFVAIDGIPYTSPDGIAWEYVFDPNFGDADALAWSPALSLYVAVGSTGYITTSTDGRTWSTVDPAPTAVDLYGVAWLNGRFYALGNGGTILTSTDGRTWTSATTPAILSGLISVAWNGQSGIDSLYVASGYSTVFTSSDGDTWTEVAAPPLGFNDSIAWGGGSANCFVTVGTDNHIFSSPNGETWTRRFLATSPNTSQLTLNEVVWTGTRFVAVGGKGTILESEDGMTWSIAASGADLKGLAYDGSRFIAVGDNGRLAVSSDVNTWEYRHAGNDAYYLYDLVWDGSRYLSVGQTYSLYSDDLILWHASWEGATSTDTAIIWDGSQFVRTGDGIMTWDGVTYYTGTSDPWWEWSYFTNTEWFNDLLWDGAAFVAVGDGGVIYTSPDATEGSWTARTSGTASDLEAVAQGVVRLVAVGAAGTILTSDDGGVSWATQNSGVSSALYDVTWSGSQFVAVGYYGRILTSADGSAWTATSQGTSTLYSVLSNGADTVIVGARGTIIKNNQ